jgi:hypothetical protein
MCYSGYSDVWLQVLKHYYKIHRQLSLKKNFESIWHMPNTAAFGFVQNAFFLNLYTSSFGKGSLPPYQLLTWLFLLFCCSCFVVVLGVTGVGILIRAVQHSYWLQNKIISGLCRFCEVIMSYMLCELQTH